MSSRVNSKRSRAMEQLTIAQDALAKALNFLGGKPRGVTPAKLPPSPEWIARGYIVSCINRISSAQYMIAGYGKPIQPDPDNARIEKIISTFPRDDFEREYDKERSPGC